MKDFGTKIGRTGFSLLELLIVLAIAAVAAGVGLPALQNVAMNARRLATLNGLVGAIQFARSAAQTQGETIVLCPANVAVNCSGNRSGTRWIVVGPSTAHTLRVLNAGDPARVVSNRTAFEFRPYPLTSTNGTLSYCDPRGGAHDRAIVVSQSGRPRLERPATVQGLPACNIS